MNEAMVAKIEITVSSQEQWDKHDAALQEAQTLSGMVRAVMSLLRYLGCSLLEQELARRNEATSKKTGETCKHCGSRLESKGQRSRKITTLVGVIG